MNFSLDYLTSNKPETIVKNQINRALNSKPDNLFQQFGQDQDIRGFVAPYYVNPFQRQMLSDLIGKKNVADIEMFNALVYSNIIQTRCGDDEENYLDPVSGRVQCRRKTKLNTKQQEAWNNLTCPDNDNPFAFEKYLDTFGQVKCRTPVLRGQNSCPPGMIRVPGPPDGTNLHSYAGLTNSLGMYDGTGVCTPNFDTSNAALYPYDIVGIEGHPYLHGKNVSEKIKSYVNMFEGVGLNYQMIKDLNSLLKNSKYSSDFRNRLMKQPNLVPLQFMSEQIVSDDDLKIANTALYETLKRNYPHKAQKISYGGFVGN
jgi:hypothetical protein